MDKRKNTKVPHKTKKKGKKSKKKVDKTLTGDAAENAKQELIKSLCSKCNMSEEQVLAAYDSFYAKYPSGEITQEFLNQQKYPIFCVLILGSVRGAELSGNNLGVFVQSF